MRRVLSILIVALAVLAGSPSFAAGKLIRDGAWPTAALIQNPSVADLALHFSFTKTGCLAASFAQGSHGEVLTFTRSTTKLCPIPVTPITCSINHLCVTSKGALIEGARTNYALNSSTHPKTSEASGTLPLGLYVGWINGTGALTIVAGTAVVSGLSCTGVAAGGQCNFQVTTAGTVLITTTAGTTHVQVEGIDAYWPSSQINTAGSPVLRAADEASYASPLVTPLTQSYCVEDTVTVYGSREWGNDFGLEQQITIGNPANPNSSRFFEQQGINLHRLQVTVADQFLNLKSALTPVVSFTAGSTHQIRTSNRVGTLGINLDESDSPVTISGAGTGRILNQPASLYIGTPLGSGYLNSYAFHKNLRVYRSAVCR